MPELTKAQIRRLWVDDLRANGHLQGKGTLCRNNKYCCLGRLCEIAVKNHIIPKPLINPRGYKFYNETRGNPGKTDVLPDIVRDWVGLRTNSGGYQSSALSQLNDTGESFDNIANIIESQPEGLFLENFDF